MKDFRITEYVKKNNFEGVWGELKSKKGFQRLTAKFSFAIFALIDN